MSYYYEVHVEVNLKKDIPDEVYYFLNNQVNGTGTNKELIPKHVLFRLQRWGCLFLNYDHWGHVPPAFYRKPNGVCFLRINCEINHGFEEIESFVNWITPYVTGHKPIQYIGWYKGEESEHRINLYVNKSI